jgi:hypothetical protein
VALHFWFCNPNAGDPVMDAQADGLRAGEDHAVDPGVLPQVVPDVLAPADDEVEHARWQTGVAVHLEQLQPRPGSVFGRLEHDRVPGHESRRRHAGREGEREIEGRDAGEHPIGAQHIPVALDGRDPDHVATEPVRFLHLVTVVVDQVRRFLSVAHGLEPVLADLEAHQGREIELAFADQRRRPAQQRDAQRPGRPGPGPLGVVRRGHRPIDLLRACRGETGQHDRGVDRRHVQEWGGRCRDRRLADPEGVLVAQAGAETREGTVELPVKRVQIGVDGRIGDLGHRVAPAS